MEFQCYCGTWRQIWDQYKCRTRDGLYMHANRTHIRGIVSATVVKSRWNIVAWRQSSCLDVGVQWPDGTDWLGFATTVVLFPLLLDFLHFFWEKSPTHCKSSSAKFVAIIVMMLPYYLTLAILLAMCNFSKSFYPWNFLPAGLDPLRQTLFGCSILSSCRINHWYFCCWWVEERQTVKSLVLCTLNWFAAPLLNLPKMFFRIIYFIHPI